jgi:hypothetical protein
VQTRVCHRCTVRSISRRTVTKQTLISAGEVRVLARFQFVGFKNKSPRTAILGKAHSVVLAPLHLRLRLAHSLGDRYLPLAKLERQMLTTRSSSRIRTQRRVVETRRRWLGRMPASTSRLDIGSNCLRCTMLLVYWQSFLDTA